MREALAVPWQAGRDRPSEERESERRVDGWNGGGGAGARETGLDRRRGRGRRM